MSKKKKSTKEDMKTMEDTQEIQLDGSPAKDGKAPEPDVKQDEKLKELSSEEKLEQRVAELEDKLLRSAAEFDNYRKRTARQFDDISKSASGRVLTDMLEVVDNVERALATLSNGNDIDSFREGTQLIFNQMKDMLAKHGVEPIEALGQKFDPLLHEALMQVKTDDYAEGVVAAEMSRGYRIGDRVLRYSKVGVSRGCADSDESCAGDQEIK